MHEQATKVDSENEKEDDVICNGFNNYLDSEEEQSAFDMAQLLSGMSQEYIFELLKHLKVRYILDLFLSNSFSKGKILFCSMRSMSGEICSLVHY